MIRSQVFYRYTSQILNFSLPGQGLGGFCAATPDERTKLRARRAIRAMNDSGRAGLLLLGLGQAALAGELARTLPDSAYLLVLEPEPGLLREALAQNALTWLSPDGPAQILSDSSLWALACLSLGQGLDSKQSLCLLNPEEKDPDRLTRLKGLRELFSLPACLDLASDKADFKLQDMTLAAILRPREPELEKFAASLPRGAGELVLVWDALEIPDLARTLPWPDGLAVRHFARPLADDFSGQRNFMLAKCRRPWVFYLDADERLSPSLLAALPPLLAQEACQGVYFPRLTLYPDDLNAKIGAGLWPDLQLRLFKPSPQTRFERPVHERLTRLSGRAGLAPDAAILHFSNLLKNSLELELKHAGFNAASGQALRHVQSPEYPFARLEDLRGQGQNRLYLLPSHMGWPA